MVLMNGNPSIKTFQISESPSALSRLLLGALFYRLLVTPAALLWSPEPGLAVNLEWGWGVGFLMSCTSPMRLTTSAPSLSVLTADSPVINHDISLS